MRLRRLSVALLPLAFSACLSGTDYSTNVTPAVSIEQTTFAASLNVDLALFSNAPVTATRIPSSCPLGCSDSSRGSR